MIQHACRDCGTTFWGRRNAILCLSCREQQNRKLSQLRMQAKRRGESRSDGAHRPFDLTTEQIEARLAAGDAERKRTRQQCGRRTA